MNRRAVAALVRRDIKVVMQSKGVVIPLIVVPLLLLVLLPALSALAPLVEGTLDETMSDLKPFLENMPAGLRRELAQYNDSQMLVAIMVLYMLAPMYLIVPLMVASVIAADSFAGEKERKTLEALLYTPTTDRELFVAKLLSAWVPSLVVSLLGFLVYGLVANVAGWRVMGRIYFPNAMWLALAFWVSPAIAGIGLGFSVIVSAKVSTFQEAYQTGGAVVLLVLLPMAGQVTGVMYFSLAAVLIMGLVLWILAGALIYLGSRAFRRTEILTRL